MTANGQMSLPGFDGLSPLTRAEAPPEPADAGAGKLRRGRKAPHSAEAREIILDGQRDVFVFGESPPTYPVGD